LIPINILKVKKRRIHTRNYRTKTRNRIKRIYKRERKSEEFGLMKKEKN